MAERPPKKPKPPRALRPGKCSADARHISNETGLGIVEVENLLREGRTREDLLALAERKGRR